MIFDSFVRANATIDTPLHHYITNLILHHFLLPKKLREYIHYVRAYHRGLELMWHRKKCTQLPLAKEQKWMCFNQPILLRLVSYKRKSKCGAAFGCRKTELKSSIIRQHCSGQTCDNIPNLWDGYEEDEINEEETQTDIIASIFRVFLTYFTFL